MSGKPKKTRTLAKKEPKLARQEIKKPSGHIPIATVISRHGTGMINRAGKGFSMGELSSADLPVNLAGNWGVPRDFRRRSVLEPNVQSLKKWFTVHHTKVEAAPPEPAGEAKPTKKRATRKKKAAE